MKARNADFPLAATGDLLFTYMARLKPTDHLRGHVGFVEFLPRTSSALTTNVVKDVMAIDEPRLLVITGHLYLDYILHRLLVVQGGRPSNQMQESFSRRLKKVEDRGWLRTDHIYTMREINRLRNRFAHDIFYDLADWDPASIPYFARRTWRRPVRRHLLAAFNKNIFRLAIFSLLVEVSHQHQWLYLEKVPR